MYRILVFLFSLLCASQIAAHEPEWTIYPHAHGGTIKLSGYTRLSTKIPAAQKELLSAVVEYRFRPDIIYVEQALHEVLKGSGYALAEQSAADPNLPALLGSPLPRIQRHIGPARIDEILKAIAGPAWELVVDPVNRLVSFELKREFWPCDYHPQPGKGCKP